MPYVLVGTWFMQLLNLGITDFRDEWQKGEKLKPKILSKLRGGQCGHSPRLYTFRRPCTFNQKDGYLAILPGIDHWNYFKIKWCLLKFIYSGKGTKFCEILTLLLSYVGPVKIKVKISHNFVAFSEYMNFIFIFIPLFLV